MLCLSIYPCSIDKLKKKADILLKCHNYGTISYHRWKFRNRIDLGYLICLRQDQKQDINLIILRKNLIFLIDMFCATIYFKCHGHNPFYNFEFVAVLLLDNARLGIFLNLLYCFFQKTNKIFTWDFSDSGSSGGSLLWRYWMLKRKKLLQASQNNCVVLLLFSCNWNARGESDEGTRVLPQTKSLPSRECIV